MNKGIIGFGTFPNKEILIDLLPVVVQNGFKLIDTSDDYYNEEYIGQVDLNDCNIMSKYSLIDNELDVESKFIKSNKKLGGKMITYLLHWPYPFLYIKIWRKMEKLYLSGKVQKIGVCNFDVKHLKKLLKKCTIKPMYNEIELHPLFQQKELVDFCKTNDIEVISYSPFARMDRELFESSHLKRIAENHNTTIFNVILSWNNEKGFIPIPSSSKKEHIKSMCYENISKIALSKEEIEIINSLDKGKRVRFNPNTYFSLKTKLKLFIFSLYKKI